MIGDFCEGVFFWVVFVVGDDLVVGVDFVFVIEDEM